MAHGRPVASSEAIGAGSILDGNRTDVEQTHNQMEAFIRGMSETHGGFMLTLVSVPLSVDEMTLAWRNISTRLSAVRSETWGNKAFSAGVALPLAVGTSAGTGSGDSHTDRRPMVSASRPACRTPTAPPRRSHCPMGCRRRSRRVFAFGVGRDVDEPFGRCVGIRHGRPVRIAHGRLRPVDVDSVSQSVWHGQSLSHGESVSNGTSLSEGTSLSHGQSTSLGHSVSQSEGQSQSLGQSVTSSQSESISQSAGTSTSQSLAAGQSVGTNWGQSASSTQGVSLTDTQGLAASHGTSLSQTLGLTQTHGQSNSDSAADAQTWGVWAGPLIGSGSAGTSSSDTNTTGFTDTQTIALSQGGGSSH